MKLKKQGLGSLKISKILKIKNRSVIEGWINKSRKPLSISSINNPLSIINKINNIEKSSAELAYIVGLINGDGHLQIKKDKSAAVSFFSKHIEEIKNIDKLFIKLFSIRGHIYKDNNGYNYGYKLCFTSIYLAEYLLSIGIVEGKKIKQEYSIPNWIMKGDKKIKAAFLKGIFSAEGFITKSKQNKAIRYRAGITQYKDEKIKENCKKYLEQIKNLVEGFGISCSNVHYDGIKKRKDGGITQGFKFTFEKNGFDKFYRHIGFDNIHKNQRILEVLKENKSF